MKSLFVLLSVLLYCTCFQELSKNIHKKKEYCVISDDNHSSATCHTLKYYMRDSSLFFKNNTVFVFYAGDHHTDFNVSLQVSNVSGLTLEGHDATIQCSQRNNFFHFAHVHGLSISGLNFSQCGLSSSDKTSGYATLLVSNVANFDLTDVVISRSEYQGIFVVDTIGDVSITNSIIEYCQTNRYYKLDTQPANAIFCENTSTKDYANMTVTNTLFLQNANSNSPKLHTTLKYNDSYAAGLTVLLNCPRLTLYLDNITADGNSGRGGGNLAFIFHAPEPNNASQVFLFNSVIKNGMAVEGGGIFISVIQPSLLGKQHLQNNHLMLFIDNTTFVANSASFTGGAISIIQKESNTLSYIRQIAINNCWFIMNSLKEGGQGGTAITSRNYILTEVDQHISPQFKTFISSCFFHENFVKRNKRMSAGTAVIFVKTNPYFSLCNVSIILNNSSGILGLQSNLVLSGTIIISNNSAESGGGILLCQNAVLFLEDGLNLRIVNNSAQFAGGGIAVESLCMVSEPICFFQLASSSSQNFSNISIQLHNNSAQYAGDNLYGGSVDYCFLMEGSKHSTYAKKSLAIFQEIFDVYPHYSAGLPYVTSQPDHVCICINNSVFCNIQEYHYTSSVYPGQLYNLSVILTGQLNGSVPGLVIAELECNHRIAFLDEHLSIQNLSAPNCTNIGYVIYSNETDINVTMKLGAYKQDDIGVMQYLQQSGQLNVNISISDCPKGFVISHQKICLCEPIFKDASVNCDITNRTIVVPADVWIGSINTSTKQDLYVAANHCPSEYCSPGQSFLNASLTDFEQDSQCLPYRTGILCGKCINGYSVTFGGNTCKKCSNSSLWLLLLYAFAGVFLVFVLTFLDITVADGTINGLIFYANIVQANHPALFPSKHYHGNLLHINVLSVFVRWISLGDGIEKCLFNGMNEKDKAWISFAFPFYIWIILGLIVISSRRSALIFRLIGSNAVKVFATLILLSYSKLVLLIIAGIDYTTIMASDGHWWIVWTKDGNIPYYSRDHLPLFVFSLCLAVVLIPFTFSLLFIQFLERYSHRRIFYLVNKFKPLLDAYTGPYTDSARFWTGFLLFARILLYVCSIVTGRLRFMQSTTLTTALLVLILTTGFFLHSGIYRKKGLQILEGSLLLNLTFLFIAASYNSVNNREQTFYTIVFVGVAFLTFIAIIIYHVAKKIYTITCLRQCVSSAKRNAMQRTQFEHLQSSTERGYLPPIVQFTEDREPLLADS